MDDEGRQKASAFREKELIRRSAKTIWPSWTRREISKSAIPPTEALWIIPTASYSVSVNEDYLLDMPITPWVFLFRTFVLADNFELANGQFNTLWIDFYGLNAKPQQQIWSCIPNKTVIKIKAGKLFIQTFTTTTLLSQGGLQRRSVFLTLLTYHCWIWAAGSQRTTF